MSNLLTTNEIKQIKLLYKKRFVVIVLRSFVVLSILAGVCLVPSYLYSKNQEDILLAKKDMFEKRQAGELKQSLISSINDINTRLDGFSGSTLSSPITASFIDPIIKAKVSSITLSSFSYAVGSTGDTARVGISGVSGSREAILSFAGNLKKTSGVTNVDVPITNFIQESNMPFTVTITVKLK